MAAQKGIGLLIKTGDGASPEVFTAIGGLRTGTITLNGGTAADITSADDTTRQRQLLAGTAVRSVSASGEGVFVDDTAQARFATHLLANTFPNLQLVVPGGSTYEGSFHVTSLETSGAHDGEVTYSVSVESAGDITVT